MAKLIIQDERGFNQIFSPIGSTPLRALRRNDWFVARSRELGAKRILELGCGSGAAAAHVAQQTGVEVVAVDLSDRFVEHARETYPLHNLHFERMDILSDDIARFGQFDLIYGNGILHHLVLSLDQVLRAMHTLCRSGGGLAFIEPNFLNPYCAFIFGTSVGRRFAKLEPDEMAFTPSELKTILPNAGWHDVVIKTKDFLLPGLPKSLSNPILRVEPLLESTVLTSWLAQSHFISARY